MSSGNSPDERSAAKRQEYALLTRITGNEVSRYDTRAEADDAVKWYAETYGYGHVLDVREVPAGSGPVCLRDIANNEPTLMGTLGRWEWGAGFFKGFGVGFAVRSDEFDITLGPFAIGGIRRGR